MALLVDVPALYSAAICFTVYRLFVRMILDISVSPLFVDELSLQDPLRLDVVPQSHQSQYTLDTA